MLTRQRTTNGASRPGRHWASVWLARGLAALMFSVVVLATSIWVFRLTVAELVITWLAASKGLGPAEITVEEIGIGQFSARDIRLGRDGSVRLRRIVAAYSAGQLMSGKIGKIALDGVRIRGRLDNERFVVAGTEPPLEIQFSSPGPPSLPVLAASSVRLEDASVNLDTPQGRIALSFEGTIEQADENLSFAFEAKLRHARGRARATWRGTARAADANSVALRLVSRHRAEFDGTSVSGGAVIKIDAAEHTLGVAFELVDTAVRQAGIDAAGIAGRGSLRTRGNSVDAIDATFRVARLQAGGLAGAIPRLALAYDGEEVSVWGQLRGAAGEVELTAEGSARDAARPVSFALNGFVRAAAVEPLLVVPARAKGRLVFDLTGELRTPAEAVVAVPGNWQQLARLVTMTRSAGFDLVDVSIENRVSAAALTATANLAVANGTLRIESTTGLTATNVRFGPAWSGRIPEAIRGQLVRRSLSISIGSDAGSRFSSEIQPLADGWDVRAITGLRARSGPNRITAEFDSRIGLDRNLAVRTATLAYLSLALKGIRHRGMAVDVELLLSEAAGSITKASGRLALTASARGSPTGTNARARVALDVDGTLAVADGRVRFTPAPGSKAVVSRLEASERIRLSAPLTIGFGGPMDRISIDLNGGGIGYRLRLAPIDAALELAGRGGIRLRLPSVLATGGGGEYRFVLADGEVTAGFASLAAAGIAGRLGWRPGSKGEARLTLKRVSHTGVPTLIAPLALEVDANLDGDKADFSIRSPADAPAPSITISGHHDLTGGRGTADLRFGPVRFTAGGLQPGALSPRFADIVENAEGALGATGKIAWDANGLIPRVIVELDGIGFNTGNVRISGMEGRVLVDGLAPPSTASGQRISARAVIGELPPMPIAARFQMRRDGKLVIETASLDLAGGTLTIEDMIADPGRRAAAGAVTVAGVSVEQLLALLKIPELSGTGRLAGRIEVRVSDGRLVSAKGSLATAAKGVLRLTDLAVLKNLARREDTVGLAMKALANFRYNSLAIEIDVGENASGAVLVRLEGANPEVLENYPFAFNINLETDFGRLAELLMGGARSAEAFIGTTLGGAGR